MKYNQKCIYVKKIIHNIKDWFQLQKRKYINKKCRHLCSFCEYKEECLSTKWYIK